jgi:hypothetical protein
LSCSFGLSDLRKACGLQAREANLADGHENPIFKGTSEAIGAARSAIGKFSRPKREEPAVGSLS